MIGDRVLDLVTQASADRKVGLHAPIVLKEETEIDQIDTAHRAARGQEEFRRSDPRACDHRLRNSLRSEQAILPVSIDSLRGSRLRGEDKTPVEIGFGLLLKAVIAQTSPKF